jgi:hypothetical protein
LPSALLGDLPPIHCFKSSFLEDDDDDDDDCDDASDDDDVGDDGDDEDDDDDDDDDEDGDGDDHDDDDDGFQTISASTCLLFPFLASVLDWPCPVTSLRTLAVLLSLLAPCNHWEP